MIDITKLKAGVNNRKPVKWPGTNENVFVRVLSEADFVEASRMSDSEYKERGVNLANIDERREFKELYLLYLSIVDDSGKRVFDDFKTFTEFVSKEIKYELLDIQNAWQEECSPNIDFMTDEEFRAVLDTVKKNPETVESISSFSLLRRLITTLVVRPAKLLTGN